MKHGGISKATVADLEGVLIADEQRRVPDMTVDLACICLDGMDDHTALLDL